MHPITHQGGMQGFARYLISNWFAFVHPHMKCNYRALLPPGFEKRM